VKTSSGVNTMAAVFQKTGSATGMLVVKTGLMNEDAVSDIIIITGRCAKRITPLFRLLRERFTGFSPSKDDMLYRWGEIKGRGGVDLHQILPHRCMDGV